MLRSLDIRNLAIIEALSLEFGPGFTVLTGETGAGKSILIDAIGLVIGTRAEAALVRSGCERAEVTAEFDLTDEASARVWLSDNELADPDQPGACVVRRVVYAEGRTRAFVNGSAVSAGKLRELGEQLIEVFGQNESQTLLRADVQRQLLDAYGTPPERLTAVARAAREWHALSQSIERLRAAAARDPAQLDYLRYLLNELEALNLRENEVAELDIEHKRLANAGRLLGDGALALDRLYGGDASLFDQLASVGGVVGSLSAIDPAFESIGALIGSAQTQVREAADTMARRLDRLDLDPEQLVAVERRMADIQDLARKHRVRSEALPERLEALRNEVAEAEEAASGVEGLERQLQAAFATYRQAAEALGQARREAAERFQGAVTERLRALGMANALFSVAIEPDAAERPRPHGDDQIRFDFSANPGQPPRPLAKVASGGELSRLSLAIQVSGSSGGAPTMIFDEVDAGIGGGVAEIVGQQLRELGRHRQALCVTHLAQVASQGRHHFGIRKEIADGKTYTRVDALGSVARIDELARMLGGVEITGSTRALARELLDRAG